VIANLRRALGTILKDDEFTSAMERCARGFGAYRERLPLLAQAYTRTRLSKTPRYEIVVMQWAAGSQSPIHDHGDSRCWVLMLEGTLAVENFLRDDDPHDNPARFRSTGKATLRANDIDHRLGPRELHRVCNPGVKGAYSLQLYSRPLSSYFIFDETTGSGRIATATCDLELDVETLLPG
jgi:hypothetical protein